jgi:membrane protease YdiL (CAAX protease family)
MKNRPVLLFFILTFAITWGIGALYACFPDRVVALFGPISNTSPLFYVAVYAPSLSGLFVTAYADGRPGLRDLLRRLFHWRVGIRWYLVVFLGVPAILVGSAILTAWWSGESFDFEKGHKPLAFFPVLMSLVLDAGPLGEELGWRGCALPRLLRRHTALTASLIVGLVWGVWHLPAFFIDGLPQNQLSLPAFLVGSVGLSVLMTWVYQHTNGSILIAVLIHWLFNFAHGTMEAMALLVTLAAVVVVGLTGPQLSRAAAKVGTAGGERVDQQPGNTSITSRPASQDSHQSPVGDNSTRTSPAS